MRKSTILKRIFLIKSKENNFCCPICTGKLSGYDHRKRIVKNSNGEKETYLIRRLKCKNCHKLHTEIPDFILPYKQYKAEVIESEIDETRQDCPAEDSTRQRWKKWFIQKRNVLESMLRMIYVRTNNKALKLGVSLLDKIRTKKTGWLTALNQILLEHNLSLPT